jgi:hypothetical protein
MWRNLAKRVSRCRACRELACSRCLAKNGVIKTQTFEMTKITEATDPILLHLQTLMDEVGLAAQFSELDPFGERHGSWQRTLHSYRIGLDRFVVVAVTDWEDCFEIAVLVGAEQRALGKSSEPIRFRRFEVGTIRVNREDPHNWPSDAKKLLDQAVRMAIEIEPLQLEERQLQFA